VKVILDANVYISYLLARKSGRSITEVVDACLTNQQIELVAPQDLLAEIRRAVLAKPYIRTHILEAELAALEETLRLTASLPPAVVDALPRSRDVQDDYLLAHGLIERADYLVTGDDDLLVLDRIESLRIVSVPVFWSILRDAYSERE
jgi:putative PIN family toxin of toxin-antitoxin system